MLVVDQLRRVVRRQAGIRHRQQRRRPIFVGDAEPAIGDVELRRLVVVHLLVGVFLQSLLAEIADQAFMQDVVARHVRRAVARDQAEGIQRDGRAAGVGDLILDGEKIVLVDRDGALEGQAVGIGGAQLDRGRRRQGVGAVLLPHRVLVGHLDLGAGRADPAELGVIGLGGVGRREQHDRGRLRIDGLAILHERQVVDARALERNAAAQPWGVDLDAGRGGDGGVTLHQAGGRGRRAARCARAA